MRREKQKTEVVVASVTFIITFGQFWTVAYKSPAGKRAVGVLGLGELALRDDTMLPHRVTVSMKMNHAELRQVIRYNSWNCSSRLLLVQRCNELSITVFHSHTVNRDDALMVQHGSERLDGSEVWGCTGWRIPLLQLRRMIPQLRYGSTRQPTMKRFLLVLRSGLPWKTATYNKNPFMTGAKNFRFYPWMPIHQTHLNVEYQQYSCI